MNKKLRKKIITAIAYTSVCLLGASALFVCTAESLKEPITALLDGQASLTTIFSQEGNDLLSSKRTSKNVSQNKNAEKSSETEKEAGYTEGLNYNYVEVEDENGRVIDKYYVLRSIGKSESEDIVIPEEVNHIPVREIHPFAFMNNSKIKSVVIPKTVEVIGKDAFKWCANLESVSIPKTMGVRVDEKGKPLDGVIDEGAFSHCLALKSITIPTNVKKIHDNTFYMCYALEDVNLHNQIEEIGKEAFARCLNLPSIMIPSKVSMISDGAFYYCQGLKSIELSTHITRIGKRAFAGCSSLTEVELPNTTTVVDKYAFAYCDGLEKVVIPEKISSIADNVFAACTSLKNFEVSKKNLSFEEIDGNLYTEDKKTLVQYAIGKEEKEFTVPSYVECIADAAFGLDDSLESVTFENGVKYIGDNAFYGCENFANVTLCNTILQIGENAFRNCYALEMLVLPIPRAAEILEVPVEPSVEMDIFNYAFRWCHNLEKVYVKGDYKAWKLKVNLGLLTKMEDVDVYYYSDVEPTEEGNYWHYVDGVATAW
ncbi:MAG: leucine-rich repeat domain-containing protein [Clostridiales bacterium]|nr:leucine-rich repeat domain-containing protein [Clostridiales bacterium]